MLIPLGPYDLSKFLNVEFGGEEHEAAIAKILKAAKSAGKIAAIFCKSTFILSDLVPALEQVPDTFHDSRRDMVHVTGLTV
jgi:2-keto-3-deoxy-L-rhamnonate aldolase RhmA